MLFGIFGFELRAIGGIVVVLLEKHACAFRAALLEMLGEGCHGATHAVNTEWRNAEMQER